MLIKMTKRVMVVLATLLCLIHAGDVTGQDSAAGLLDRPVNDFRVEDGNALWVLSNAARTFDIPIGFEGARDSAAAPKVSVNVRNGTMRDVLGAVLRQDPRYEWRVVDGVINVFPKAGRDDLLASLLSTPVREFSIAEGTGRKVIQGMITDLPEVKAKLEAAQVIPTNFVASNLDVIPVGAKFSLTMTDTTLRGLLNRVVRDSTAKFWVLRRDGANGEKLILNF